MFLKVKKAVSEEDLDTITEPSNSPHKLNLLDELQNMLELVLSGEIYSTECFSTVPKHLRRLNDIAFSGDGEPTTYKNFDDIIE